MPIAGAWGAGPWGKTGWGGPGLGEGLELLDAQPQAENRVRLLFNRPPLFTGLSDPNDGAEADRYSIIPIAGTVGSDGLPPRPVFVLEPGLVREAGADGLFVDVWVDRSFSPYPARYLVSVNLLRATTGEPLTPGKTSFAFDGLAVAPASMLRDSVATAGDFANPQTVQGIGADGQLPPAAALLLGTFPIDGTGDYGIDKGLRSYKKRIFRRLLSTQGSFAHLAASGYGAGVLVLVKTLARPGVAEHVAAEAEAQIKLEPETKACRVSIAEGNVPGLFVLKIRAQTFSGDSVAMDVPFTAAT